MQIRWGIFDKMKHLLIILTMTLIVLIVRGQKKDYRTELDTIQSFENKTLVHFKIYINEKLVKESTAYLVPTTLRLPKYRLTGNLIKKTFQADSIVYHGLTTVYQDNGDYSVYECKNGQVIKSSYFDYNENEISEQQYYYKHLRRGPYDCKREYFGIYGLKKKKKKNKHAPTSK